MRVEGEHTFSDEEAAQQETYEHQEGPRSVGRNHVLHNGTSHPEHADSHVMLNKNDQHIYKKPADPTGSVSSRKTLSESLAGHFTLHSTVQYTLETHMTVLRSGKPSTYLPTSGANPIVKYITALQVSASATEKGMCSSEGGRW